MRPNFRELAEKLFRKLIIRKYSPNDIEVLAHELEDIYDQGVIYGVLRASERVEKPKLSIIKKDS